MNAATLLAATLAVPSVHAGPAAVPAQETAAPADPPIEATVLFDDDSAFSGPISVADPSGR